MKRYVKIAVSLCVFGVLALKRGVQRILGLPQESQLTILLYHAVPAGQVRAFERQIRQLARWARVVPADWAGDNRQHHVPDGIRLVAITFDDAFESALDHALPVLAAYDLACTVFVPSGHLGRIPSWAMKSGTDSGEWVATAKRLEALPRQLVTIGSHTVTHPHLTSLPRDLAVRELEESKQALTAISHGDVELFAFPYGDYDPAVVQMCRASGYKHAFSVEPVPVGSSDGSFIRGRVVVEPSDGRLEFFLKATGSYRWMPAASRIKRWLSSVLMDVRMAVLGNPA